MDYDGCSTASTDSRIVVKENRSKFEVINKNRTTIKKVQVDGCLIEDKKEKCDWIVEASNKSKIALFIELKGCDLDKAISQLISTLKHTNDRYKNYRRECFVVTTRVPKHGASARRKSIEFHKQTKTTLSIKNLKSVVEIDC